jgi:aarF domain-containing kinase
LQALGPLRPLLLPLPTPLELLTRLQPAVALSPEDEEALATVRGVVSLAQRLQAPAAGGDGGAAAATAFPSAALLPSRESVAGAVRAASELSPLLPQIAPGLAHTGELLLRALARRAARRVADAAGEVAAAATAASASAAAERRGAGGAPGAPVFTLVAGEEGFGSPGGGSGSGNGGAAAAGQVLVGLAAAPLMLALAPLGLLAQMQRPGGGRRE